METRTCVILNVPVHVLEEERFEKVILELARGGAPHHIMLISSWDILKAQFNKEYRFMLASAALVIPTTKGLLSQARFLGGPVPVRYMPFDFVIKTLGVLERNGGSTFILGAKPRYLQRADQNLRRTFPGLRIVGRHGGYYPKNLESDILRALQKATPSFLLVGGGVRGGNRWLYRNKRALSPSLCLCDPMTLDVIAGRRKKVSRETFQKGREGIPELARHPWRVLRLPLYLVYGLALLFARILHT